MYHDCGGSQILGLPNISVLDMALLISPPPPLLMLVRDLLLEFPSRIYLIAGTTAYPSRYPVRAYIRVTACLHLKGED